MKIRLALHVHVSVDSESNISHSSIRFGIMVHSKATFNIPCSRLI